MCGPIQQKSLFFFSSFTRRPEYLAKFCKDVRIWKYELVSLKKQVISSAKRVVLISFPLTKKPLIFLYSRIWHTSVSNARINNKGERGSHPVLPKFNKKDISCKAVNQNAAWQLSSYRKFYIHWRKFGPKPIFCKNWYKNSWFSESKAFSKSIASRMPGWFIILPIPRTSSIVRTGSKIDRPFIKTFCLEGISNGITAFNRLAIALDAIFTSTL